MIISIAGTHCAGKTTLAHRLYSHLLAKGKQVDLLVEIAGKTTKADRTNLYTQYYIMSEQILNEQKLSKSSPLVITDRSVFDNLAYITLNLQAPQNWQRLDIYKKAWELFFKHKDNYDGIIFVNDYYPINPKDPKRDPNEKWQKWILHQIRAYLDAFYAGPILELDQTSPTESKVKNITKWIEETGAELS